MNEGFFKEIDFLERNGDFALALEKLGKLNLEKLRIKNQIKCHFWFGLIYYRKADYGNSFSHIFMGEKLALTTSSYNYELVKLYGLLRALYDTIDEINKSLNIAKKALKICRQLPNNSALLMDSIRAIGAAYQRSKEFNKSIKYIKEAYTICVEKKLVVQQFNTASYLIYLNSNIKNYQEALKYIEINNSLLSKGKITSEFSKEAFYCYSANCMLEMKKTNEVREICEEQLKKGNELGNDMRSTFLNLLQKSYIQEKNYKDAYRILLEVNELKSEILNKEKQNNILELEAKYEVEKKELEINKLKELDETKARIFSNITHELRTPLTLITSPLQECLLYDIPNNCKEYIHTAIENSNQMLHLINQLLDISKLDSGLYKPIYSYGDIIQNIDSLLNTYMSNKTIQLSLNHSKSYIYANFDSDKLEKIITNLLSNAIKYSSSKCKIEIYTDLLTEENNNLFYFSINDHGIGISEVELPHIFNRFYRGEDSSKKQVIGSGIGLSIVKEFLDLLGGRIQVSSKYQKGTKVEIWVPISDANFSATNEIYEIKSVGKYSKKEIKLEGLNLNRKKEKKLILIVEDNVEIANFLSGLIQPEYDILYANNGNDGFKLALQKIPDIVISDIMMPVTDGIEMTKMIKSNEIIAHTPVILLSAKSSQEVKNQARSVGADYYFSKPFHPLDIKLTLKNIIQQNEKIQKLNDNIVLRGDFKKIEPNTFLNLVFSKVSENYMNESFNVDELANKMNLSTSQFNKKFAKVSTLSPRILIESYRLHKAKKLLVNDDKNVSEVAYEVGYKDVPTFTRAFKRYFETLPSDYKR